jgi:hypothetical protein
VSTEKIQRPGPRLRVGDMVRWRGSFGSAPAQLARVEHIEATAPGEKYGAEVDSVSWTASFVVDLDNGHWARSHQLEPAPHLQLVRPHHD